MSRGPLYRNPLRSAQITPERIDQGVDYSASGPIYALGTGIIRSITNSGWPGGAFIAEELTSGSYAGKYTYYAEDISPEVSIGQTVNANTVVGQTHGQIEIGWAAPPPDLGETEAMLHGQASSTGDPGSKSTAYGVSFSNLLKSLGAPGGKVDSPISGSGGTSTSTDSFSGNIFSDILDLLGLDPKDALIRLGLIALGGAMILLGIFMLTGRVIHTAVKLSPEMMAE